MVSEIAEQEVGHKEAVSRERKVFSGKERMSSHCDKGRLVEVWCSVRDPLGGSG